MRKPPPAKTSQSIRLKFAGGKCLAIHSDALAATLRPLGAMTIRRASHVEPEGDKWAADMSPVGGPMLAGFTTRNAALRAEVRWLNRNILR